MRKLKTQITFCPSAPFATLLTPWRDAVQMNKWKIGALVGGILGLTAPYAPLLWLYGGGHIISFVPPDPFLVHSMAFYFVWSLSTIFGVLIGAIVGYLIDKYGR